VREKKITLRNGRYAKLRRYPKLVSSVFVNASKHIAYWLRSSKNKHPARYPPTPKTAQLGTTTGNAALE
jgi:hypothetical protein